MPSAETPTDRDRVAILNGFGRTIGDAIIGLQALTIALTRGTVAPRPVLFRLPGFPAMVEAVHAAADFAELRTLSAELGQPGRRVPQTDGFGCIIELRELAREPEFQHASMIDFFLRRLGVDPATVAAADRHNAWLKPRVRPIPPDLPAGYALVCPHASMPLRMMPERIHKWLLERLAAFGPVATQGAVPQQLAGCARRALPADSFAELCGLVAHARFLVSTDTGMVHLADAFDVPCLAFFPTHRPETRVRGYPRCTPVELESSLPDGIVFERDEADLRAAEAAWFLEGNDMSWLDGLVSGYAATQPICAK